MFKLVSSSLTEQFHSFNPISIQFQSYILIQIVLAALVAVAAAGHLHHAGYGFIASGHGHHGHNDGVAKVHVAQDSHGYNFGVSSHSTLSFPTSTTLVYFSISCKLSS